MGYLNVSLIIFNLSVFFLIIIFTWSLPKPSVRRIGFAALMPWAAAPLHARHTASALRPPPKQTGFARTGVGGAALARCPRVAPRRRRQAQLFVDAAAK